MKKQTLNDKISAAVLGSIFLLGVIAVGITFVISRHRLIELRQDAVIDQLIEQTHETGQLFVAARSLITTIAQQDEIRSYLASSTPPLQPPHIRALLERYNIGKTYDPIYILAADGTAVASLDPLFVGQNYMFRDYARHALNGETFIEAALGTTTGRPGYYIAAPVYGANKAVIGAIIAKIDAGTVNEGFRTSVLSKNGRLMLVDNNGLIVYSDRPDRLYKSIGTLPVDRVREIIAEKRIATSTIVALQYDPILDAIRSYHDPIGLIYDDRVDNEQEILTVVNIPNTSLYLITEQDIGSLILSAARMSAVLGIYVSIAAIFIAIGIYLLLRRLLRPFELLREGVTHMSSGDYSYRLGIATGDEFQDIGNAFDAMADRLRLSHEKFSEELKQKTSELSIRLEEIQRKNASLQETQRAVLNVLEDARSLEVQLQEERDHLRAILASMGEGLLVFDRDFRIILSNPMAEHLMRTSAKDLFGKDVRDLVAMFKGSARIEGQVLEDMRMMIRSGKGIVVELKDDYWWEIQGKRRFPIAFVAAPLAISGIAGTVFIFRDLTKEKNLDEARSSFISITSHQLRTPLTSMKWFLEMLIDGYADPLTDHQKEFVDLAYQAGIKMMNIINLLLQIARVEAGRVRIAPVMTDLKQFTQQIVMSFGNAFERRHQTVEIVTVPDPLPSVPLDTDIMEQVIANLISNANRYALENTTITITIEADPEEIVYSVTDRGIGISKIDEGRIFEKFFRAENALRAVPEGSGLGLSLVKSLVEGWGGRIWFESEEWKGTTFHFSIPLVGMQPKEGEVGITVSGS